VAITCQQCGLKNPNSAVMCDCGLQLRAVDQKTLEGAEMAHYERQRRSLAKPIGLGAAGLVLVIIVLKVAQALLSSR
jgi:hypothetical protein